MYKTKNLLPFTLRLFDEAGATEGAPVAVAEGQAVLGAEGAETGADTGGVDLATEFRELISGKYKDVYKDITQAEFQSTFNKRFAPLKQVEEKYKAVEPVIEMVMQKYGVDDIAKVQEAIQLEMVSNYAEEAGLTIEQAQKQFELERKAKLYEQNIQSQQSQEYAQRQLDTWYQQANELKASFPDFDLDAEAAHAETGKQFTDLLRAGVPVSTAYQVVHIDDVKKATAEQARANALKTVHTKGARPLENGMQPKGTGTPFSNNPADWSREQVREAMKKMEKGEKVFPT